MSDADTAFFRNDGWGAFLSPRDRWEVYNHHRAGADWSETADWAAEKYHCKKPSKSALYRFLRNMRRDEWMHKMEEAAAAREIAEGVARSAGADESLAEAIKAMMTESVIRTGSAEEAAGLERIFRSVADRAVKVKALELKERAIAAAEENARLAREKFEAAERRLDAAAKVVAADKLTDEERVKRIKEIFSLV